LWKFEEDPPRKSELFLANIVQQKLEDVLFPRKLVPLLLSVLRNIFPRCFLSLEN